LTRSGDPQGTDTAPGDHEKSGLGSQGILLPVHGAVANAPICSRRIEADWQAIFGGVPEALNVDGPMQSVRVARGPQTDPADLLIRAVGRRLQNGDLLAIGRNVDETREISQVVGQALGLVPAFSLCLLAGAWLSVCAQKRVEEVNQRVQRIIAGDPSERLSRRNVDEPLSRLAAIVKRDTRRNRDDDQRALRRR
jgi:hypothetical protein